MNHYYFADKKTEAKVISNLTQVPKSVLNLGIRLKASFLLAQIKYIIFNSFLSSAYIYSHIYSSLSCRISVTKVLPADRLKSGLSLWHCASRGQAGRTNGWMDGS